jgi:hypothetical protein
MGSDLRFVYALFLVVVRGSDLQVRHGWLEVLGALAFGEFAA